MWGIPMRGILMRDLTSRCYTLEIFIWDVRF